MRRYLEVGKCVATHGLQGEVRVYPLCDGPSFFSSLKTLYLDAKGERPIALLGVKLQKNIAILKLEGVDRVEDAHGMIGRVLYCDREEVTLPEGTYFVDDLIGLRVFDAHTGRDYGTLCEGSPTGANDVYHIEGPDGQVVLIPAIPQVIARVDLAAGRMEIRPMKGLFDDED